MFEVSVAGKRLENVYISAHSFVLKIKPHRSVYVTNFNTLLSRISKYIHMVHLAFIDRVNMLLILNKHYCNTGYTGYETICIVYIY